MITYNNLKYTTLADGRFTKESVRIIQESLLKGHTRERACALAQVPQKNFNSWLDEYMDFKLLVEWAEAAFMDKLFDVLNEDMASNSTTAIRLFSELRKEAKDKEKMEKEGTSVANLTDELFNVLNGFEEENDAKEEL